MPHRVRPTQQQPAARAPLPPKQRGLGRGSDPGGQLKLRCARASTDLAHSPVCEWGEVPEAWEGEDHATRLAPDSEAQPQGLVGRAVMAWQAEAWAGAESRATAAPAWAPQACQKPTGPPQEQAEQPQPWSQEPQPCCPTGGQLRPTGPLPTSPSLEPAVGMESCRSFGTAAGAVSTWKGRTGVTRAKDHGHTFYSGWTLPEPQVTSTPLYPRSHAHIRPQGRTCQGAAPT